MAIDISELQLQDYDALEALWHSQRSPDPIPFDSVTVFARFLQYNSGLSVVARDGHRIIGAVLCRRNGNRGCVENLVVDPSVEDSDILRCLFDKALRKLAVQGIHRLRVDLLGHRGTAAFWQVVGGLNLSVCSVDES